MNQQEQAQGRVTRIGISRDGQVALNAALALASNPAKLRKRLHEARSVLTAVGRKAFGRGRFDFHGRRLIGNNGLALQWLTRPEPDQPVNYRNQQTTVGCVILVCPQDPYTIEDYRNAPSGIGPLAADWKDKPHRLVYDLCRRVERAEKTAPTAVALGDF